MITVWLYSKNFKKSNHIYSSLNEFSTDPDNYPAEAIYIAEALSYNPLVQLGVTNNLEEVKEKDEVFPDSTIESLVGLLMDASDRKFNVNLEYREFIWYRAAEHIYIDFKVNDKSNNIIDKYLKGLNK